MRSGAVDAVSNCTALGLRLMIFSSSDSCCVVSRSSFFRLSSRKVSVGAYVNQGDVLGITGSTGHSTGPHLHFEISENGVRINPLNYLTGYTLAG